MSTTLSLPSVLGRALTLAEFEANLNALKATADAAVTPSQIGAASGVAPLDSGSKVPVANLPQQAIGYDICTNSESKPTASQVLLRFYASRAFQLPVGLTGSMVKAAVAATASATFNIQKNGSTVGSFTFAAAGTTATFTMASATSWAAGDLLTIIAPASQDATLAQIGATLLATLL